MAGPNPLVLFVFYRIYRKRFYKKPKNAGKKPMGCLCWFFVFLLKIFLIAHIFMLIFVLVAYIFEWFEVLI